MKAILGPKGISIDQGGTLYSDNEIVLNSAAMDDTAARHGQTRGNSNEYEPWQNAGVESTFRTAPAEMRKMHVRSGVPDEFWDFSAIQASELLCDLTTARDTDMSRREMFGYPRANVAKKYRVWGCRVIARKPVPWRDGKIDAQAVEGINLGRCRTKPGWWVWSPEYGLMTSSNVTFFEDDFPFTDGRYTLPDVVVSKSAGTGGGGGIMPAAPMADDDDGEDDDDDDHDGGDLLGDDSDSDDDSGDDGGVNLYPNIPSHWQSGTGSVSGDESSGDQTSISHGTLDDQNSSSESASIPSTESESTYMARVLASVIKKIKAKKDEQDIPPPWRGLHGASDHVKQLFMEAEMKEINGILDVGAAYEVKLKDLPEDTKIYGTLTIRNIKKNGPKKGTAKVRVCVNQGPKDVESHSPTLQMATMRAMLAMGGAKKAKINVGDFPQAYLNAFQDVYYVWAPKTARQIDDDGDQIVWALPRALYGGRASGRHWYKKLRTWLLAQGFTASEWDPCLFCKVQKDGTFHYVGVYVDDLIHVYTDGKSYAETVEGFKRDFHGYSDLGPITEIFNAEVDVTETHVTLTQKRFIEALAEKYLEGEVFPTHTPVIQEIEKSLQEAQAEDTEQGKRLSAEDHAKYRGIVGAMLYASTVCRPDIGVAVGLLSRVLERPTHDMMAAALRTLRYLVTTKALGLRWNVGGNETLIGMSDSDWAVARSTSGYIFFLCQAAIAYISQKQHSIAMSSTEAEIMAASLGALEAVVLRGLLGEMGLLQKAPTVLHVDNQGAIALAKNYVSNKRTKHIERRHLKIRELVEEFKVRPEFIPTEENVADIMTKPLGRRRFEKLRRILMNHEG